MSLCSSNFSRGAWYGLALEHNPRRWTRGKHDSNSRDTSPAVPWAFPASMPSVTPPPDALSVVHPMRYRSLFTETRSPNGGWLPSQPRPPNPPLHLLPAPQVFLLAAQEEPGRPAPREPARPPRGTYTLAGRWIIAADRMIQNMTMAPDEGATSTMKEGDDCGALAREAVGHADRHLLCSGDGAGDYRVTA